MLKFEDYNNYKEFLALNKQLIILESQELENDQLVFTVKEDIERCIAKIMGTYKFFAKFIYRLRIIYTYRVPTMGVNESFDLFINPKFASTLTDKETMFVLCHEIIHLVLVHINRGRVKGAIPHDHEGWNIAADYETNAMLVEEGLLTYEEVEKMGACIDKKYNDMIAEAIYDDKPSPGKEPKQMYPVEIGSVVKTKSGQYGQIASINADGSYNIKELTKEEAKKILYDSK